MDLVLAERIVEQMIKVCVISLQMKTIEDYVSELGNDARGVQEIQQLFALLEAYNIREWFEFDPTVVRGLAYYTGVVFEGFDRAHELRAICGGGRYDKLIETFGGEAIPAVGFGFGDAVVVELLKTKNLLPDTSLPNIDMVAYAMQDRLRGKMLGLVQQLRDHGVRVDVVLDSRKPKWVFQRADRAGASLVLMVAEDEDENGLVTLKDMRTGNQDRLSYTEVLDDVIKKLQTKTNT
jgi:histidyl-tRNA synthetase